MELTVNLGENSYPIYIENGILAKANQYISQIFTGRRIAIISDDNVFSQYGERLMDTLSAFECSSIVLPHGESTKGIETLPDVYARLLEAKISRSDLIIALGGGVIGDLAGFVAATYLRGIKFIQIPTSLLAQVDSSIGGKVAVDLPQGKNLVGAFYHPRLVLIDPDTLKTLPKRYINDGMGEVIKYGCIRDAALFGTLRSSGSFAGLTDKLTEIIYRCVDIKREVVENDPFDNGERMLLNFGHTLAHTIEQFYHYERESHGEAVAIGMYQITLLSEQQGLTEPGTAEKIKEVLEAYDLPTTGKTDFTNLRAAISLDKKNLNNALNLVLLHEIGDSFIYKSTLDFFQNAAAI